MSRIRHRGPDDSGFWQSPDGVCALGHVRLSIVDLTPAGHQPMTDPVTGNVIVFNGEIYNYLDLRAACERDGERFQSRTDTEVILSLYRRHGVECLQYLRGMFAFGIWDKAQETLFLARDRVGKKPLNYSISENGLIFASEINALVQHQGVSAGMDPEALELYLQLQYVPAPWTIYKSIRKLAPAHYAVYSRAGLQLCKYWDVDYRGKVRISEGDAIDGLEEQIREAVRLRMIADVPLGALLSGGVDSSVVVALMAGLGTSSVKTYSMGFREDAFSELKYAAQVADRYHTDHCAEIVDGDIEPLLADVVRHYGEPFADSSAVPSFRVCRAARKHVKVVMNGDGGDELLGGYPRYWLKRISIAGGQALGDWQGPQSLAAMLVGLDKASGFAARARRKWLLRMAHPELQSMLMYSAFWNDEERSSLLGVSGGVLPAWRSEWLASVRGAANNPIDRMLWIDNRTYLPGDLLVKMDIAAMHCGLETRSPLLDHKLIEYCASLPVHLKVRNGTGKYLLKKLAERYMPHELIYRPKMGFGIPLAEWLRGTLRPLVEEILSDRSLTEPLDQAVIARTLTAFLAGEGDHSSRIWAVLMFGLWRRHCRPGFAA